MLIVKPRPSTFPMIKKSIKKYLVFNKTVVIKLECSKVNNVAQRPLTPWKALFLIPKW